MHGQESAVKLCDLSPLSISSKEELEAKVLSSLEGMLAGDAIRAGDRLPSERAAARELKVSRNLVTAAYNRLEERGLIRRLHGKGAFRCQPQNEDDAFSWSGKITSRAHLLDEPVLELLARARRKPIPFPFSAGTPSMECFPLQMYRETVDRVISQSCPAALTVAPTEGQDKLRQYIGQWLNVEPRRVMVTSGVTRPPGVTSGPGVVTKTVERIPACGRSIPWRRQNMLAQAPPAQSTLSAATRPRSVTTPAILPPAISNPRTAHSCSTVTPSARAAFAKAGAAMLGSATPSVGAYMPPIQSCSLPGVSRFACCGLRTWL